LGQSTSQPDDTDLLEIVGTIDSFLWTRSPSFHGSWLDMNTINKGTIVPHDEDLPDLQDSPLKFFIVREFQSPLNHYFSLHSAL
jgi:hypothetical protein